MTISTGSSPGQGPAIAVVGAGRIGEALLAGLLAAGRDRATVSFVEKDPVRGAELSARLGVAPISLPELAQVADVVVIAVKPQDVTATLGPLAQLRPGCLVISLCAGLPIAVFERALPIGTPVIRVMPNTPMLIGKAVSALSPGTAASEAHLALAEELLGSVGRVVRVPESQQDLVTALSGSGPAYFYLIAEALIDAGVALGLSRAIATELVVHTGAGSTAMLAETGTHPVLLREAVTSPGGTTAAGIGQLEAASVRDALFRAVSAAAARSEELGRAHGR